jgi:hypothetical protein
MNERQDAAMRKLLALTVAALVAAGLTGCLAATPDTSKIVKISSTTSAGYVWDYYRNEAYPCAVSGYQTFVIGRKVGSSDTATTPLWVFQHGGGVGGFSETGQPLPNANRMDEESRTELIGHVDNPGLTAKVRDAGFRIVSVSMCSHDLYGGMSSPDPNNPNTTPEGEPRPTTGLISVKSAVAFAKAAYPTDDTFLHGGSAGSAGTIHTAWSLQLQGDPPDGIIPDASVLNQEYFIDAAAQGICVGESEAVVKSGLLDRIHPVVADPANQPHLLVARGDLTVPIMHVWNEGDTNTCSDVPMQCTVDGTTVTLGSTTCMHEPLTRAIDALGPTSRSENLALCVEGPNASIPCDKHVVTPIDGTNTRAGSPADYNAAIWSWVGERLADD